MNAELAPFEALAKEVLRRCFAEEDPTLLQQWLLETVARMGGGADAESAILTWADSFDLYDRIMEQRALAAVQPDAEKRTLDWKWASWNEYIDPLEPGLLAVLSAGDGMGKTIYAEELAEHWAQKRNRVVFVHYELNRSIMLDRRTARHTSIPRRVLKSGLLDAEQTKRLNTIRPRLLAWDGYVTYMHTPGWSMDRVVSELRRLRAEGHCDVVVLDYLEKNSASRRQIQLFGQNVYQREADNVEQIKNYAESTETPVLMLTQMSKAGKSSSFESLDRTAMRGAGEKSEKANIVVLLNREHTSEGYSNTVDVRVDKNTVGRTGTFQQYMEAEYFRVADLQRVPLSK
jgi:replicative DNA helicase